MKEEVLKGSCSTLSAAGLELQRRFYAILARQQTSACRLFDQVLEKMPGGNRNKPRKGGPEPSREHTIHAASIKKTFLSAFPMMPGFQFLNWHLETDSCVCGCVCEFVCACVCVCSCTSYILRTRFCFAHFQEVTESTGLGLGLGLVTMVRFMVRGQEMFQVHESVWKGCITSLWSTSSLPLSGDSIVPPIWSTGKPNNIGVTRSAQWAFQWGGNTQKDFCDEPVAFCWGMEEKRLWHHLLWTQTSVPDPLLQRTTSPIILYCYHKTMTAEWDSDHNKAGLLPLRSIFFPLSSMASLCSLRILGRKRHLEIWLFWIIKPLRS